MMNLNIPTFEMKKNLNTACITYKILNNQSAPYLTNSFKYVSHTHNTRFNDSHNLQIPRPRHEYARQCLTYTGSHGWNNLDSETKNAATFTIFKSKYRTNHPYYKETISNGPIHWSSNIMCTYSSTTNFQIVCIAKFYTFV